MKKDKNLSLSGLANLPQLLQQLQEILNDNQQANQSNIKKTALLIARFDLDKLRHDSEPFKFIADSVRKILVQWEGGAEPIDFRRIFSERVMRFLALIIIGPAKNIQERLLVFIEVLISQRSQSPNKILNKKVGLLLKHCFSSPDILLVSTVLLLKEIFIVLFAAQGPLMLASFRKLQQLIELLKDFQKQEVLQIPMFFISQGLLGKLPFKIIEQKNLVLLNFLLLLTTNKLLWGDSLTKILQQKYFDFAAFFKLWSSYKKLLNLKVGIQSLKACSVIPSTMAQLLQGDCRSIYIQILKSICEKETIRTVAIIAQTFNELFEQAILKVLAEEGLFLPILNYTTADQSLILQSISNLNDKKLIILLLLSIYKFSQRKFRGPLLVNMVASCSVYEIIILKSFRLPDSFLKAIYEDCLGCISQGTSAETTIKLFKYLKKQYQHFNIKNYIQAVLKGTILQDSILEHLTILFKQNFHQVLDPTRIFMLLEKRTKPWLLTNSWKHSEFALNFLILAMEKSVIYANKYFYSLIETVMQIPRTQENNYNDYPAESLRIIKKNMLASKKLRADMTEQTGPKFEISLFDSIAKSNKVKLLKTLSLALVNVLKQCSIKYLQSCIKGSVRFRELSYRVIGRLNISNPAVQLFSQLLVNYTFKFYEESQVQLEQLKACYQMAFRIGKIKILDFGLLDFQKYRHEIIRNGLTLEGQRAIVANFIQASL